MKPCYGRGPRPCPIFFCGEKPGIEEVRSGIPFSGASGQEQSSYLARHHLTTRDIFLTNIIKHYIGERNPDPDEILQWSDTLQQEISSCNPQLIVAIGAVSARYFLGESTILETVHGLPHRPGQFDPSVAYRSPADCVILPIYNPALGFKDADARSLIAWDYAQVADAVRKIRSGTPIAVRQDEYSGVEDYRDVSGSQLEHLINSSYDFDANEFAIDTEGSEKHPFCLQVSWSPGTGYMLRRERDDFERGARALHNLAFNKQDPALIIAHNWLHDLTVLRAMHPLLDFVRARLHDTMYQSYISRIEAYNEKGGSRRRGKQGLKHLAWRWNAMEMVEWDEFVGDIGLERQLQYLEKVVKGPWEFPKFIIEQTHDAVCHMKKPQPPQKIAAGILRDWHNQKRNSKGELIDLEDRWKKIPKDRRRTIQKDLGTWPRGSVRQVFRKNPKRAIRYGCRDSDATIRYKRNHWPEIVKLGKESLMQDGMDALPVFWEMQYNGMPASRSYFQSLSAEMWDGMMSVSKEISKCYFGGRPFNPNSPPQTRELLQIRGLKAEQQTDSGEDSTAKNSIEHLRYVDPAFALLFEGREKEHIRDKFATPILEAMDDDDPSDIQRVRSQLLNTRTATRRLAGKNPNPLNLPVRTKLGRRVREGFQAPEGKLLGAFDLSQIEYRVLASYSADPTLLKWFNEGKDIHTYVAATVNGIPVHEVDKDTQRRPAKTMNYGMVYLQTPFGLATTMRKEGLEGWTEDRCAEFMGEIHKLFPGIKQFVESVRQQVWRDEYAESYAGMRRYLPGIRSQHRGTANEALRHAMSQIISGTAQDMIQYAMIWLKDPIWEMQDQGKDVRWLLQVHDELILEFEEKLANTISALVLYALENKCKVRLRVPVEAEGKVGRNWAVLK